MLQDKLVSLYIEKLLFGEYGIGGKKLTVASLPELEKKLSPENYAFLQKIDLATKKLSDLLSEDKDRDGTESDEKFLKSYEELADDKKLAAKFRIRMYNMLLDGRDRYFSHDTDYLKILQKKVQLLTKNDVSDLRHSVFQMDRHSPSVDYGLEKSIMLDIYRKCPQNNFFTQEENDELKRTDKKQKAQHRCNLFRGKLDIIDKKLEENLPPEERAKLLEDKFDLVGKIGQGRFNTARAKLNLADELHDLYVTLRDYGKARLYEDESVHQKQLIANIISHTKKPHRNY